MYNDFEHILRQAGQSITKPRLAVFATLAQSDMPLKNGEIARRTPNVDRASIYRTLELFDKLNITETITRGWTPYTELAEPFRPHHHHMTCEACGTSEEIESGTLEDVLTLIANRHDFTLTKHIVELTGMCKTCQGQKRHA